MRALSSKTNVTPADAEYPYARAKNNTGSNNGTPVDEALLGDALQFFEKIMDYAGISANGLPDNAYDDFQLWEALQRVVGVRKFTKEFTTTDIEQPLVITYAERTGSVSASVGGSASGDFNPGFFSTENDTSGTVQSTPTTQNVFTDFQIQVWFRANTSSNWYKLPLDTNASGTISTVINYTTGDITVTTGNQQGIYRVVVMG